MRTRLKFQQVSIRYLLLFATRLGLPVLLGLFVLLAQDASATLAARAPHSPSATQSAPHAPLAAFTVNNLGDASDANPGNGVCATSGGVCTLRAALQEANALGGTTTIDFSVTGAITLGSTLPTITATNANITLNGPGPKATSLIQRFRVLRQRFWRTK